MTAPAGSTADAARHPIAVVAERTGLTQDVLRVWERRYGAVEPARGPGGQRLYSDADVERLALLHAATRAGRAIGQVARLATDALAALVAEDDAARERRARVAGAAPASPPEPAVDTAPPADDVLDAAIALARALDAARLDALLRRTAARVGMAAFVERVAAPLLRRVGDEWHAGRITPAQEHLVSSLVHDLVAQTMRAVGLREGAPRVLVATPAGDRHALGAALAGAAAAVEGWSVLYLGADLPAAEIADAARAGGVRLVALSAVYLDDRARVLGELRALRARLPADIGLVAGGAAAAALATELDAAGVQVVPSVAALAAALRQGPGGTRTAAEAKAALAAERR